MKDLMKYRKLLPAALLISLVCLADINGQTRSQQRKPRQRRTRQTRKTGLKAKARNTDKVQFDLCYDFYMEAIPSRMNFVTVIPKTILDRQQILDIKYSTEQSRVFSKNGNEYVEFVFTRPGRQFQLKINIKARLSRFDLFTARKMYKENPPEIPDLNDFLKHEKYIEKDNPQIQQIAKSIKAQTETDIVKEIYEYVTDHLQYVIRNDEAGAVKTLRKKKGGCTEYSDLFVALCRAKNIPARVVKGYVTEFDSIPQHAWAEAYLKEYGWVPFDLIYGDVKQKSAKNKRFQNLKPIYIYLTSTRNDPILNEAITVQGFWIGEVKLQDSIVFK
jgi:transglutaminase-like putative cysteine protease